MEAIDKMLARLQTDYIDLLYVHQPVGDFVGAWRDMEKAVAMGKVRALGISNFDANDEVFEKIMAESRVKPAVLQIECHPYAQRLAMRESEALRHSHNLLVPAGRCDVERCAAERPTIMQIAKAHGKTPAQVILRWHMQEGFSAIPGASNPDYIEENIAIFDFELTDREMEQMRALDKNAFFNATYEQVEQMERCPCRITYATPTEKIASYPVISVRTLSEASSIFAKTTYYDIQYEYGQ